jgi:hypothetical protein
MALSLRGDGGRRRRVGPWDTAGEVRQSSVSVPQAGTAVDRQDCASDEARRG